jgi:hypothetical protein
LKTGSQVTEARHKVRDSLCMKGPEQTGKPTKVGGGWAGLGDGRLPVDWVFFGGGGAAEVTIRHCKCADRHCTLRVKSEFHAKRVSLPVKLHTKPI